MTQGFMNEWQPGDPKDIDGKQSPEQMHLRSMLEPQEQWNRVHAQLLKSVADAQARLLAGINEVSDRVEVLSGRLTALTVSAAALNGNHSGLKGQLDDLVISCTGLSGRVDAIGAILAELLTVRRPGPRLAKRAKRRR